VQLYLQVTNDHFNRALKEHFDAGGFDLDIDAIFEEAAQNRAHPVQDSQEPETNGTDSEKSQVPDFTPPYGKSRHNSLSDKYLYIPPRGVEPLSPP
jgi:hypothetical protein